MDSHLSIRRLAILAIALGLLLPPPARAEFIDAFDGERPQYWLAITGDGDAKLELQQSEGVLQMRIDATRDRYGVWWTCIKRDITRAIDLNKLATQRYELRVEARVRGSHAPRRVNFMVNTQRTTNYHEHLREFDLATPMQWHTISMTTRSLDVRRGDTVFVQLCATDWGHGEYRVDVDHYRAEVVSVNAPAVESLEPLVYHPPVQDLASFAYHLQVDHDSMISTDFPDVNFNDWQMHAGDGWQRVLTIDASHWVILRWDLEQFRGRRVSGAGILELTTASLAHGGDYVAAFGRDLGEEFGKVRVIEILGGEPQWDQGEVTYSSLCAGAPYETVFNTQMIIDLNLSAHPAGKTYFTLPRPVMQRLLDGTTKGLLIRPLGALVASVHASEGRNAAGPVLHFSVSR